MQKDKFRQMETNVSKSLCVFKLLNKKTVSDALLSRSVKPNNDVLLFRLQWLDLKSNVRTF